MSIFGQCKSCLSYSHQQAAKWKVPSTTRSLGGVELGNNHKCPVSVMQCRCNSFRAVPRTERAMGVTYPLFKKHYLRSFFVLGIKFSLLFSEDLDFFQHATVMQVATSEAPAKPPFREDHFQELIATTSRRNLVIIMCKCFLLKMSSVMFSERGVCHNGNAPKSQNQSSTTRNRGKRTNCGEQVNC